jgi:uncharacterized protein
MHDHALDHSWAAGVTLETLPLFLLLFATGLWGSFTHCAGMCGPFVLTQVDQGLDRLGKNGFGRWERLRGAALLPYHLGRLTTYAALGAIAGGVGAMLADITGLRWILAGFLLVAALLFAAQALGIAALSAPGMPSVLGRLLVPLKPGASRLHRYGLGVALGFLPCGLLYGALTAAASAGNAGSGAVAMAAFALGTMPALVMVGWGGLLLGLRRRQLLQKLTRPLLAANAIVLFVLALGAAS